MTRSEKLHKRLLALGYDVAEPRRIWMGRNPGGDFWKWQAAVRGTEGIVHIGSPDSMRDCLQQTDETLRQWIQDDR